jgi:hypothetical protein
MHETPWMIYHNCYFTAPLVVARVAKIGNTDVRGTSCFHASPRHTNMARPQVVHEDCIQDRVAAVVLNNHSRTAKRLQSSSLVADLTTRYRKELVYYEWYSRRFLPFGI